MRNLLILLSCCLSLSMFAQNLEVEGKAKITQMDKVNTADSIVVWLQDSMLGIRDAASLNRQLIDSDGDTRVLVEENPDEDIIRFYSRGVEIMRIDTSGRVGIRTTQPAASLHVDSAVLFTGTFNDVNPGPPPASGGGTRLMWYPDKAAFRVGFVINTNWDSINIGQHSFAAGRNSIASGSRATALGNSTNASGSTSTALGNLTNASGSISTALGDDTNASGSISTAMGLETTASGNLSTAMGNRTQANGYSSTVLGMYNDTIVESQSMFQLSPSTPLFIIGNGDAGTGNESNAMVVRKDGKVGIGTNNPKALLHVDSAVLFTGIFDDENPSSPPVSGSGTRLMWYPRKAAFRVGRVLGTEWDGINIGSYSFATGQNTIGSGFVSTAMGNSTIASGSRSTAMGDDTNASGSASTAMGLSTTASGNRSTAMGEDTNASGAVSTAMGIQTKANGYASTVLGMFNDTIVSTQTSSDPLTPLFIIGNGDFESESNAMVVRKDGKVGIGTNTPGTVISNALVEVKDGHIALSNDYGVFSNSSTGTGLGAGFDTSTDDDLFLFAGGSERVRIEENGEVGIGTDSPTALLEVNADIVKKVNGGTWTASSDRQLKQDIRDYREGLDKILDLRPVYFHYNEMSGYDTSVEHIGIIAQELQEVAPHMVSSYQKDGDQYLQVDNSAMIYMLVNAVREQQVMINQLQEEIEKLKKQDESSSLTNSEMK